MKSFFPRTVLEYVHAASPQWS